LNTVLIESHHDFKGMMLAWRCAYFLAFRRRRFALNASASLDSRVCWPSSIEELFFLTGALPPVFSPPADGATHGFPDVLSESIMART